MVPHVLDDLQLDGEELLAPGRDVDVILQTVELQVDGVQAGVGRLPEELGVLGELDAVGGGLDLGEPELLGLRDHIDELADRWSALRRRTGRPGSGPAAGP